MGHPHSYTPCVTEVVDQVATCQQGDQELEAIAFKVQAGGWASHHTMLPYNKHQQLLQDEATIHSRDAAGSKPLCECADQTA